MAEYQVHQTVRGATIAVRAAGDNAAPDFEAIRPKLVAALARAGLTQPEVSITTKDHIERQQATGILRRFVR